jgi:RNA polymerase sigma-70 factor (ECF subfamily)
MNPGNEKELIKRIQDGETGAFSALLHQHQDAVFSLIVQIVSSREDAEELTQDVFIKAFKKINSFRGDSAISTWLYRIAYNTAISATRKRKQVFINLEEKNLNNMPDEVVDELLNLENDEKLLQNMKEAIEKLKPDEKALISLFYMQGRPVNEIASITKLTPENVKVKLFRTRKKIAVLINQAQYEAR